MRTYEALYIVQPDLKDDEIQTIAKNVESRVTENGGTIVRSEIWGKRRLAYEVQRHSEGCYVLLRFTAAPSLIARLENDLRLLEPVIRYLVVHFDDKTLRLEAEQKRRKEEEIKSGLASKPSSRRTKDERESEPAVARGNGQENH